MLTAPDTASGEDRGKQRKKCSLSPDPWTGSLRGDLCGSPGVSSKNEPQVPTPLSPAFPSLPHFSPRPVPLGSPPKTTHKRLLLEKPKPQQPLFRGLS